MKLSEIRQQLESPNPLTATGRPDGPEVDLAYRFDGKGKARRIDFSEAENLLFPARSSPAKARNNAGFTWLHCQLGSARLADLHISGKISTLVFDHLGRSDTRPVCIPHNSGLLVNLRGHALVPDEEESDLVSLRLWITREGVASSWRRPSRAVAEMLDELLRGAAPRSSGQFVARLALRIVDTIEPMVDALAEAVDELEIEVVDGSQKPMRRELSDIRRQAIDMRRFLFPQRDAFSTMLVEHLAFVHEAERAKLHEAEDRMVQFIEELEVTRERCAVLHDEIIDSRSERMNKQILLLSVVSALFLPATLIAGLLGMNVAGIPAAGHPLAFLGICLATVALIVGEFILFRWLKII